MVKQQILQDSPDLRMSRAIQDQPFDGSPVQGRDDGDLTGISLSSVEYKCVSVYTESHSVSQRDAFMNIGSGGGHYSE